MAIISFPVSIGKEDIKGYIKEKIYDKGKEILIQVHHSIICQ